MKLSGRANGGPLNGIKIESGAKWTGFVKGDSGGRYVWNGIQSRWDWTTNATPSLLFADEKPRRKSRGKPRETKKGTTGESASST